MARVTFSQEDINRSKLLPVSWYPVTVSKYTEDKASTDGSELYVFELKVDSGQFKDVPLRFQISEKAMGMGVEFLDACGIEIKPGVPVDLGSAVGKKLDAFVQRGEYRGRPNNQVVQFRKRQ